MWNVFFIPDINKKTIKTYFRTINLADIFFLNITQTLSQLGGEFFLQLQ